MSKEVYSNIEMELMIGSIAPLLDRSDMIGYAAARNTRILTGEAHEYLVKREELIEKYGRPQLDGNGKETGFKEIEVGTPAYASFESEIREWANAKHSPDIYKISAEEAMGKLTGKQILEIEWMLEW